MTAKALNDSDQHDCTIQTVRTNLRNPAEVICIRCHKRYPCEHFGMEPRFPRTRDFEEVMELPETASLEPTCTLEHFNPRTREWIYKTTCGGDIEPTHQGWIFNSRCKQCGQPYLNNNVRLFNQMYNLDPLQ